MQRRKFIKHTSYTIIGMGVFGNISLNKEGFIGDTPTTTDILGPFYRPGAPFRQNLNPHDFAGELLHLRGTIYKEDGKTPMRKCLLEIWQCQADGNYDNLSDDYRYRASQKTDINGKYHFITTRPVAYPTDETKTTFRPAHIHLRISAIDQQDLITQIYFKDDPYLISDPSTKSGLAFNRILSANKIRDNESEILFDIILKKQSLAPDELFRNVCGIYKMSDNSKWSFTVMAIFFFIKPMDKSGEPFRMQAITYSKAVQMTQIQKQNLNCCSRVKPKFSSVFQEEKKQELREQDCSGIKNNNKLCEKKTFQLIS